MAEAKRSGDLELNLDQEFQQREWRVERIGWVLMLLLILASLLGLLGGAGPLSSTTDGSADGLEVSYNRFAQMLEATTLQVHVSIDGAADTLRLWLSQSYLDSTRIESISPEPASIEVAEGRLIFNFELAAPVQETDIVFHLNPELPGLKQGAIGVEGGSSVELSQFVYP